MKRSLLVWVGVVLLLSGCIQTETTIRVEKDGSGTVEQTVVFRQDIVEMIRGMQAALGNTPKGSSASKPPLYDRKTIAEEAKRMGQGVRVLEIKPHVTPLGEGYRVRYGFSDVNRLRVYDTPLMGEAFTSQRKGNYEGDSIFTFAFSKGNPATLLVRILKEDGQPRKGESFDFRSSIPLFGNPADKTEGTEDEEEENDDEEEVESPTNEIDRLSKAFAWEMMRELFRDVKVSVTVEVGGTITFTDAEYRSGSLVKLMEVDFNALLNNREVFEMIVDDRVKSLNDLKAFSKVFSDLQVETKPQVRIQFR